MENKNEKILGFAMMFKFITGLLYIIGIVAVATESYIIFVAVALGCVISAVASLIFGITFIFNVFSKKEKK